MRKNSFGAQVRNKVVAAVCSVTLAFGLCPAIALADEVAEAPVTEQPIVEVVEADADADEAVETVEVVEVEAEDSDLEEQAYDANSKYIAALSCSNTWVLVNNTFNVSLKIETKDPTNAPYSCGQFTVTYNPAIVSLTDSNVTMNSGLTKGDVSVSGGTAVMSFYDNSSTGLTVATLKFKAIAPGDPQIKISDAIAGASGKLDDRDVKFGKSTVNITAVKAFTDVSTSSSYYDVIYQAVAMGLIGGYSDGTFRPSVALNRQQAAIMFYRAYGSPSTTDSALSAMTDQASITNTEARKAISWCITKNIVSGKNGSNGTKYFDPKGQLTRQQLCTMVARAAKNLNGVRVDGANQSLLNTMTDQASIINAEARNAIAWCMNNNIVGGKTASNGTKYFDPKASATRAQFTKILVGAVTQHFVGA